VPVEPVTITTTHNTSNFDPESHRGTAAVQLGLDPAQIHCISGGPDEAKETEPAVHSRDGTGLKPRVVTYTRKTTWDQIPRLAAPPAPAPPPPVTQHVPQLHRGARWHGTIDGVEDNYISTGNSMVPTVMQSRAITPHLEVAVAPSRRHIASILLSTAALALAAVGVTINGWFARSLGSSDAAGWLFLAVGVAADLIALVMPSCAASLWYAGQRVTALVGWALWLVTFVFAVTAGIGFASTNISDVTLARASRLTPAVTSAQAALTDAMAARDRECKGGVGKYCRDREAEVTERRQVLDSAMASVGQGADRQTESAIKLVAWVSRGMLRPAPDDFAMLRLMLLALLPQIGGTLMMVGRRPYALGTSRS
jgi:hypothetical protein